MNFMAGNLPLVSVIMPIYKAEKYLSEALDSIFNQSFQNFEIIIVSDDTDEETMKILQYYSKNEPRLRIFHQKRKGLIESRNMCFEIARGEYLAIMDSDDISMSDRFQKQIDFFRQNPESGIVGSWIVQIDTKGNKIRDIRYPITKNGIVFHMLFHNCLANSSVMLKKEISLKIGKYQQEMAYAEDYDYWSRAILLTEISNIPEPLVLYRIHQQNVSSTHDELMKKRTSIIRNRLFNRIIGKNNNPNEALLLEKLSSDGKFNQNEEFKLASEFLQDVYQIFLKKYQPNKQELEEINHFICNLLVKIAISNRKMSYLNSISCIISSIKINPVITIMIIKKIICNL